MQKVTKQKQISLASMCFFSLYKPDMITELQLKHSQNIVYYNRAESKGVITLGVNPTDFQPKEIIPKAARNHNKCSISLKCDFSNNLVGTQHQYGKNILSKLL